MNPLASAAIGSVLRWLLAMGAGLLVEHGIWTQGESAQYVTAATLALLSLGWSLWTKYRGRLMFLTALQSPPGATEADVHAAVADGAGASLSPETR